jgi:hypothetical protein
MEIGDAARRELDLLDRLAGRQRQMAGDQVEIELERAARTGIGPSSAPARWDRARHASYG